MLVLSRKLHEKIIVDDRIVLTVVQVDGRRVRIGIEAPPDVKVVRPEVLKAEPGRAKADVASTATPKSRLLLVDDSPSDRAIFRRIMEDQQDLELLEAKSAAECLDRFQLEPPDCVFLDYRLPDATGLDVLDEIRRRSRVPVIMLTGQGSEQVAAQAIKHGATDYMVKRDFSATSLRKALVAALHQPSRGEWN